MTNDLEIRGNLSTVLVYVLKEVIEIITPTHSVIKSETRTTQEQSYLNFHGVNEFLQEEAHIFQSCPLHELLVRSGESLLKANNHVKSFWIPHDGELPNDVRADPVYFWLEDARFDELTDFFLKLMIILKLFIIEKDP